MKFLSFIILLYSINFLSVDKIVLPESSESGKIYFMEVEHPYSEGLRNIDITFVICPAQLAFRKTAECIDAINLLTRTKEFFTTFESLKVIIINLVVPKVHSP